MAFLTAPPLLSIPPSRNSRCSPLRSAPSPSPSPSPSTPSHRRISPQCSVLTRPTKPPTTHQHHQFRSKPLLDLPDWRFVGAPLHHGPLPTIIYFALTAEQSLDLDPFNQLVTALHPFNGFRVLSVTLPFHSESMIDNENAFYRWADIYRSGGDLVAGFARKVSSTIDQLIDTAIIQNHAVYVAGLSRGGMLAAHLACANHSVRACLGLAPVTVLSELSEFRDDVIEGERAREKISKASLLNDAVVDKLTAVPVRLYMGNSDRRVGTRNAFAFSLMLAERARDSGVRSPPHEFIMYSSVGKDGHGTPPEIFADGADYLMQRMQADMTVRRRVEAQ